MLKNLREPVNSLTHWGGALLALIGLIILLVVGWGTPARVISLLIYGVSLIVLFSASATYHMVQVKERALEVFRKIDHAAIYFLIAGTYTPFCVNAFSGFWKWGMLSIIWSLALIGIIVKGKMTNRPLAVSTRCASLSVLGSNIYAAGKVDTSVSKDSAGNGRLCESPRVRFICA